MSNSGARWKQAVLSLIVAAFVGAAGACAPSIHPARASLDQRLAHATAWSINYDCRHPPTEDVALFVTDPASRCNARELAHAAHAVWIAYVSVGEVNEAHRSYPELLSAGAVSETNPHWPGAHVVDVRHPAYRAAYLEPVLESVASQHYDGLFLDTLDGALARSRESVVALVRDIRREHPEWVLVPNGGLDAADALRPYVDAWAEEDVFEGFDFVAHGYRATDPYRQATILPRLRRLRDAGLPVFVVDYAWEDESLRSSIRARALAEGFHPLVTHIELR